MGKHWFPSIRPSRNHPKDTKRPQAFQAVKREQNTIRSGNEAWGSSREEQFRAMAGWHDLQKQQHSEGGVP